MDNDPPTVRIMEAPACARETFYMIYDAAGAPVGLMVDGAAYRVVRSPGLRIRVDEGWWFQKVLGPFTAADREGATA
jgi:hypothetical protein